MKVQEREMVWNIFMSVVESWARSNSTLILNIGTLGVINRRLDQIITEHPRHMERSFFIFDIAFRLGLPLIASKHKEGFKQFLDGVYPMIECWAWTSNIRCSAINNRLELNPLFSSELNLERQDNLSNSGLKRVYKDLVEFVYQRYPCFYGHTRMERYYLKEHWNLTFLGDDAIDVPMWEVAEERRKTLPVLAQDTFYLIARQNKSAENYVETVRRYGGFAYTQ